MRHHQTVKKRLEGAAVRILQECVTEDKGRVTKHYEKARKIACEVTQELGRTSPVESAHRPFFENWYRKSRAGTFFKEHPQLFEKNQNGEYLYSVVEDAWQSWLGCASTLWLLNDAGISPTKKA
jgi:hypothetical protein